MKQTLSVEQSAELIKRGVSADKASEIFIDAGEHGMFSTPKATSMMLECAREAKVISPIFTLADLLSLLPKHIRIEHRHYYLRMNTFVLTDEENPMWIARYITSNSAITLHERWSEELIDALYKLIISLLDNHVKLD